MERMENFRVKSLRVKWAAYGASGNQTDDVGGGSISYAVTPPESGTLEADPVDATGLTTVFTPAVPESLLTDVQLQITVSGGVLPSPIIGALTLVS